MSEEQVAEGASPAFVLDLEEDAVGAQGEDFAVSGDPDFFNFGAFGWDCVFFFDKAMSLFFAEVGVKNRVFVGKTKRD